MVVALVVPIGGPAAIKPDRPRALPSTRLRPYPAESFAARVVARDPFRASRRPAAVAYDPMGAAQPPTPPVPKPALVLVGLVTGVEPSAVVEGFPGVEGPRVVRKGDVIAGLKVARIAPDHVRIVGMDTTWVLRVREPWR